MGIYRYLITVSLSLCTAKDCRFWQCTSNGYSTRTVLQYCRHITVTRNCKNLFILRHLKIVCPPGSTGGKFFFFQLYNKPPGTAQGFSTAATDRNADHLTPNDPNFFSLQSLQKQVFSKHYKHLELTLFCRTFLFYFTIFTIKI